MKISIDTKEDSHDEIRKVVAMLQAWVNGHSNVPPPSENNAGGLMDMFNDIPSSPSSAGPISPAKSPDKGFNIVESENSHDSDDEDDGPVELMTYD